MRKLILAATSVAVLAAPAVSMAAHSTTVTSRVNTPYSAPSYTDASGGNKFTCNGVHEVKVGKTAASSFTIDKFHCKITDPTTGKKVAQFTSNQPINWLTSYGGWNSDYNGASATSMVATPNATGTGFSAVAHY